MTGPKLQPLRDLQPENSEAINLVSSEGEVDCTDQRGGKRHKPSKGGSYLCPDIYVKGCRCKKDNPFCLAGIIPAPGGHRKKGLWQKDSNALLVQGPNPSEQLREVCTQISSVVCPPIIALSMASPGHIAVTLTRLGI